MKKIYIRFVSTSKICSYDDCDAKGEATSLSPNQLVLVENDQIIEEGRVIEKPDSLSDSEEGKGVILRVLTKDDRQQCLELKNNAREYIEEAQKKVLRHNLAMKILDADFSFDQKKLTFYFSANGRVDFRGLVLDMAKSFEKLIRLQQVGARDETKHFGGIGKCGREYCCAKFLNDTEEINLKMAKNQELSNINTSKLLGRCGKPMCCLSFEERSCKNCSNDKKPAVRIGQIAVNARRKLKGEK
ncbi:MAG: regulatory iron-sulfur-containing complex subunit RicT [Patescibacteria group bacterium]|jgi:cell fate regulator YaaT (PSP1 superfamily)